MARLVVAPVPVAGVAGPGTTKPAPAGPAGIKRETSVPEATAATVVASEIASLWASQGEPVEWCLTSAAAGVAGQGAVEQDLAREGLDRETIGTDAFVDRVRAAEEAGRTQLDETLAELGVGVPPLSAHDDEETVTAARTAFVRLYEAGLVELVDRIVLRCPRCRSVVDADDAEATTVACETLRIRFEPPDGVQGTDPAGDGDEQQASDFAVEVETAAVEFLVGAVAIAVPLDHPAAGSSVVVPLDGRIVPVIAEPGFERPELVVPGHDPASTEIARRAGLAPVVVLGPDGTVSADGPLFGLARYAARIAAADLVGAEGAVVDRRAGQEQLSRCPRCGTSLVPRLERQWFLRMPDLEVAAADLIRHHEISFTPASARDELVAAATTRGDWCLSREAWEGPRAPVSRCIDCGQVAVAVEQAESCGKCMGLLIGEVVALDARFVAAVWPLASAGWPNHESGAADTGSVTTFVAPASEARSWVMPAAALAVRLTGCLPFAQVVLVEPPNSNCGLSAGPLAP